MRAQNLSWKQLVPSGEVAHYSLVDASVGWMAVAVTHLAPYKIAINIHKFYNCFDI